MLSVLALALVFAGPVTIEGPPSLEPKALERALKARVGDEFEPWSISVRVDGAQARVSYVSSWDRGDVEIELTGEAEDDVRLIASTVASSLSPPPASQPVVAPPPGAEPGADSGTEIGPSEYWLSLGAQAGGWERAELGGGLAWVGLLFGQRLGLGAAVSVQRTLTPRVMLHTLRITPRVMAGSFVGKRLWLGGYLDPGVAVSVASSSRTATFVSSSVTIGPSAFIGLTPALGVQLSLGVEWIAPQTRIVGSGGSVPYGPVHVVGTVAVVFGR